MFRYVTLYLCLSSRTPMPWPADHGREYAAGHRQVIWLFQATYCWLTPPLQPGRGQLCPQPSPLLSLHIYHYAHHRKLYTLLSPLKARPNKPNLHFTIISFLCNELCGRANNVKLWPKPSHVLNHGSVSSMGVDECGFSYSMKECLFSCFLSSCNCAVSSPKSVKGNLIHRIIKKLSIISKCQHFVPALINEFCPLLPSKK